MVRRVVAFIDDFFRSPVNGLTSHPVNRRWLTELFRLNLQRLGFSCCELDHDFSVDVAELMARLNVEKSPAGWAETFVADLPRQWLSQSLAPLADCDLIIGWGLNPSVMRLLDGAGVRYMDFEIDPLRFARDLRLCVRTNSSVIADALADWELCDEEYYDAAASLRASFARIGLEPVLSSSARVGVLFGQSRIDASIVCNGRFATFEAVFDQICDWSRQFDAVVLKAHPYDANRQQLHNLSLRLPNTYLSYHNAYYLLSSPNVVSASALSSSLIEEAKYFLVPAARLIVPDRDNPAMAPANASRWFRVDAHIASRAFLARILTDQSPAPPRHGHMTSAVTEAFGMRWGLDRSLAAPRQTPAIELSQTYGLGQVPGSADFLVEGWSTTIAEGSWSIGSFSAIQFRLPAAHPKAIRIDFVAHLFEPDGFPAPRLAIVCGGQRFEAPTFRNGILSLKFDCATACPHGLVELKMAIEGAISPLQSGQSEDNRPLGVFIESLTVRPARAKRAKKAPPASGLELAATARSAAPPPRDRRVAANRT